MTHTLEHLLKCVEKEYNKDILQLRKKKIIFLKNKIKK